MDARTTAPATPLPSFSARVGALLWARRRKLACVAGVYFVGRSCPWWPEWAQPLCELLTKLLGALGGTA